MGATFIGSAVTDLSSGANALTVPVGVQAGDLMVIHALGRNRDFQIPIGWNAQQVAAGASETSFTTSMVCWKFCPPAVPTTVELQNSPSNNSHSTMVVYRADPGEVFTFDGTLSGAVSTSASITPGSIITTRAATVLMCPAANSGDNTQIVAYTPGSYTARENTTATGRISAAILEYAVGAGSTVLPTITLSRSEPRGFFAFAFYTEAAPPSDWSYRSTTFQEYLTVGATFDDKLYLFGASGQYLATTQTRMYNTTLNTITAKQSVPVTFAGSLGGAAVASGSSIFVLKGQTQQFYRYLPSSNAWSGTNGPPFAQDTSWLVVDADGDYLYTCGGSGTTATSAVVSRFNLSTDAWSVLWSGVYNLQYKRAAVGSDGLIYSMGGTDGAVSYAHVQRIDPVNSTITAMTSMPAGRHGGAVGAVNGLIYYAGGWSVPGVLHHTVWAYDPVTNTWSVKRPMLAGIAHAGHGVIGDQLFVAGGETRASGNATPDIQVWNGAEVNGGIAAAQGVAYSSAYAEGYGDITGQAVSTSGEAEVVFDQSMQADSFLDMGTTGSAITFDALAPADDLAPSITLAPGGDF